MSQRNAPVVGIVAGHSRAVPGAVVEELKEQELCRAIVDRLGPALIADGIAVFDPRTDEEALEYPGYLTRRIDQMNEAKVVLALEVHLNALSDPLVDYVLCLYAPGSERGARVAKMTAGALAAARSGDGPSPISALARPDTWLGPNRSKAFLRRTVMPAVIVEPCFLTSRETQRQIREDRDGWIERITQGCRKGVGDYLASTRPDEVMGSEA